MGIRAEKVVFRAFEEFASRCFPDIRPREHPRLQEFVANEVRRTLEADAESREIEIDLSDLSIDVDVDGRVSHGIVLQRILEAARRTAMGEAVRRGIRGGGEAERLQMRQQVAKDLGNVQSFGGGFSRAAGRVLDAVVPEIGDAAKLTIAANVPVHPATPNILMGFEFGCNAARSEEGIVARAELGVAVTGKIDFKILEAFLRARVFGYIEAQGDSGEEIFRLISLYIYRAVHSVDEDIANRLWDRGDVRQTVLGMDANDYVEMGYGVNVSAGIKTKVGAEASGGRQSGTRLERVEGTEELRAGRLVVWTGSFALSQDPWAGDVGVSLKYRNDLLAEVQVAVGLEAMLPLEKIVSLRQWLAIWVPDIIRRIRTVVHHDDLRGEPGRAIGRALDRADSIIAGGLTTTAVGTALGAELQRKYASLKDKAGAKCGLKMTLTGTVSYDPSGNRKGAVEFRVERVQRIEVGENPRDTVYVLVENTERVVRIAGEYDDGKFQNFQGP